MTLRQLILSVSESDFRDNGMFQRLKDVKSEYGSGHGGSWGQALDPGLGQRSCPHDPWLKIISIKKAEKDLKNTLDLYK